MLLLCICVKPQLALRRMINNGTNKVLGEAPPELLLQVFEIQSTLPQKHMDRIAISMKHLARHHPSRRSHIHMVVEQILRRWGLFHLDCSSPHRWRGVLQDWRAVDPKSSQRLDRCHRLLNHLGIVAQPTWHCSRKRGPDSRH